MVISNLTVEQSYLREGGQLPRRYKSHGDRDAAENGVRDDSEQCDENKEEAGDSETVKQMEVDPDTDNTILDYKEGDDLANATSDMIPSYNTERGVGASFLDEFKCYQCKLCRKLLDNAETAEVHLRTWRHHQLFARLLSDKIPSQTQDSQDHQAVSQESNEAGKRPSESQEDGNWKRRRTDDAESKEIAHDEDSTRVVKAAEKGEEKNDAPITKQEVTDADDSVEDWNRTIVEIIEDEKKDDDDDSNDEVQIKEPEMDVVVVKDEPDTPPPKSVATPATRTNQSPRGRPTHRGRGRGRPSRC